MPDVGPPLRLLRQAKVAQLLAEVAPNLDRFEASGLALGGDLLWIVFDNLPHIAGVDPALAREPAARLEREPGTSPGYEDIAIDEAADRRYVVIESAPAPGGGFAPLIDEYDAAWRRIARRRVDLVVARPNKGLEGLTCVRRGGRSHLLALSESGEALDDGRGRRRRRGVVYVLADTGECWTVLDRILLPEELAFTDFSGVSVRDDRIAVVSQESSALWVGRLDPLEWRVVGEGRVQPFPRDSRRRVLYGTIEGVCWLDESTVAVVSDRAKRRQPRRMHAVGESVHVFALG